MSLLKPFSVNSVNGQLSAYLLAQAVIFHERDVFEFEISKYFRVC